MNNLANRAGKRLREIGHLFIAALSILSCSRQNSDRPNLHIKETTQKEPVTVNAKPPLVTLLDTCPAPTVVPIPQSEHEHASIKQKNAIIQLSPPELSIAGFSVPMQKFTTRNGLVHNAVTRGYMDKMGNLWFATYGGGVSRYDGQTFTNFSGIPGLADKISCIYEDKRGNIWFGSFGNGICRYDGKTIKNFTTSQGLADNLVWGMTEDKTGNLWVATSNGASQLDQNTESFKNYTTSHGLPGNFIFSILSDQSGNVWLGTLGNGASCYDGKSFINYTSADGLANNVIRCIFNDSKGMLWFGHDSCKISWIDSKAIGNKHKALFMNKQITEAKEDFRLNSITEDKTGNLWFGTYHGAYYLRRNNNLPPGENNFTAITTKQGLPHNNVNSIIEDKSGNIWFCTDNGGVSRLDWQLKFLTNLTLNDELLRNDIFKCFEDHQQNLWFGTHGGGALKLSSDGRYLTRYKESQGLYSNSATCFLQDANDKIWIGAYDGGISCLSADGAYFTRYNKAQGFPDNTIICAFDDKHGNIWFGTFNGGALKLNQADKIVTRYTTEQGMSENIVNDVLVDKKGFVWFCTTNGLSRLDSNGKTFTNFNTRNGLPNDDITSVVEDNNGNLWFGTWGGGVVRYDGRSFLNIRNAKGLSEDKIRDIAIDKNGIIWFGTFQGFTVLKGFAKESNDTLDNSEQVPSSNPLSNSDLESNKLNPIFEVFNSSTGYEVEEITTNVEITRAGIIWAGLGGPEKSVRLDYGIIPRDLAPPDVLIKDVKINNAAVCWSDLDHNNERTDSFTTTSNIIEEITQFGRILNVHQREELNRKFGDIKFSETDRFYPVPSHLVLPHEDNNIIFDFAAIEPARSRLVRYQYMMEGYDRTWKPVTDKTTAEYGNIHEGSYTFKVRAQRPNGPWSKPAIFKFKLLAPWYRAWWAYVLYALFILVGLWSFIRWRMAGLRREKIVLEEKVIHRTLELQQQKEKLELTLNDLKSTQAQLIQSEKMASLGEMTSGIAHEIQNPLNFVNNFSELNRDLLTEMKGEIVKGNLADVESIADHVIANEEKINRHGKRADAIVKGMLQHSQTSTGQREPTNINSLSDEYLRLAFHGWQAKDPSFNVTVNTDFDNSIEKVNVVPQDIGRVVLNLINNAFYAASQPPKGGVSDSGSNKTPTVWLSTKKESNKILITVRDNGTGIPSNILDKIFQPFFTTKPTGEGTGLGLSLAYDIVKAHGGEIKVESREGKGTEFVVQLPA